MNEDMTDFQQSIENLISKERIESFSVINGQKVAFSNVDKGYITLSLLQNIRNRSYHWENLLKVRESHRKFFPRITTILQGTFIGIEPEQICPFLNDLLETLNKDLN